MKDFGKVDIYTGTSASYAYRNALGRVTALVCFILISNFQEKKYRKYMLASKYQLFDMYLYIIW